MPSYIAESYLSRPRRAVPLTLTDKTGPDLMFSPPLRAGDTLSVVADGSGTAHVPFAGTVSDTQSGVASLTSTPGGHIPVAADGTWRASLTLSLGAHQVMFVATDNAGNPTTVTIMVTVVSEVPPASLEVRLGAGQTASGTEASSEGPGALVVVAAAAMETRRRRPPLS